MSIFDLFSKKQKVINWADVSGSVFSTLSHLIDHNPEQLASQFARFHLLKSHRVMFSNEKKSSPEEIMTSHDIAVVFLMEDKTAFDEWVSVIAERGAFSQIATDRFAQHLTVILRSRT